MVVAGWTLEYMWQSITGALYSPVAESVSHTGLDALDIQFKTKMEEYILQDIRPLIMTYIMLAINLGILLMGVQKGIEKISNVLMPVLFILLLAFACVALSFPKASEGLEFFLHPDFSKINASVVINALGQAFFSLSLGMGILITYSSYFPKDTRLTRTAVTVSLLDMLVAVMMGMIIFPAVKSFGLDSEGLEGGHTCLRDPSRGICADASDTIMVITLLPAPHGGRAHFYNITRRGINCIHAGPIPYAAHVSMPHCNTTAVYPQHHMLAVPGVSILD